MVKKIIWAFALLLLLITIIPFPVNIDAYAFGFCYEDTSLTATKRVRIEGAWRINVFSSINVFSNSWHWFRGSIDIDGVSMPRGDMLSISMTTNSLRNSFGIFDGSITFAYLPDNGMRIRDITHFGTVTTRFFFLRPIVIDIGSTFLEEYNSSPYNEGILPPIFVLYATTRDEAIEIDRVNIIGQ